MASFSVPFFPGSTMMNRRGGMVVVKAAVGIMNRSPEARYHEYQQGLASRIAKYSCRHSSFQFLNYHHRRAVIESAILLRFVCRTYPEHQGRKKIGPADNCLPHRSLFRSQQSSCLRSRQQAFMTAQTHSGVIQLEGLIRCHRQRLDI